MSPSPADLPSWHRRLLQQAGWTQALRALLAAQNGWRAGLRLLEVGCGTGAVTQDLCAATGCQVYGLDLDIPSVQFAQKASPGPVYLAGDAFSLPLPPAAFDAVLCHYLLLWLPRPVEALAEMRRATRPGGLVAALAEPDYGGRIDYPDECAAIGGLQMQSLAARGADPLAGRKLRAWFHQAGFTNIHTGLFSAEWRDSQAFDLTEWDILKSDLSNSVSPSELARIETREKNAWATGQRVLFIPTFFAWGYAP